MSTCVATDLLLLLRLIFNTFGQIIKFIKKQLAHKKGFPLPSFLLSFALRIVYYGLFLYFWIEHFLLRLDLLRFFLKQKVIFPNCRISFLERAVTDCYYSKWPLCYLLFVCFYVFFFYAFHSQKSPGTMYYLNMTISINLSHNNNVNSILYKSRCLV